MQLDTLAVNFFSAMAGVIATYTAFKLNNSKAKNVDVESMNKLVETATKLAETMNEKYHEANKENELLIEQLKSYRKEINELKTLIHGLQLDVEDCRRNHRNHVNDDNS
jgi:uncharacterized membrane protein (DUF106 family)